MCDDNGDSEMDLDGINVFMNRDHVIAFIRKPHHLELDATTKTSDDDI